MTTAAEVAAKIAAGEKVSQEEEQVLMSSHEEPPMPGRLGNTEEEDAGPEVHITGMTPPKADKPKVPDAGAEKTPDKTGDGDSPAPKESQAQAPEAVKTGDAKEDPDLLVRVEEQLQKPPGSENLEGFTPRERSFFYEMRSLRSRTQSAENKTRTLEFELLKAKKEQDEAAKQKKDPDALATVKDVEEATAEKSQSTLQQLFSTRLELDMLKHQNLPHFKEVMALADNGFIPEERKSMVQEAMNALLKGGSPVKATYELITNDPRWPAKLKEIEAAKAPKATPPATTDKTEEAKIKEDEAKEAQRKLKENKGKAVTAGQGSEGGESAATILEYDPQKLFSMSPTDFGKLPKREQEAILKRLNGLE